MYAIRSYYVLHPQSRTCRTATGQAANDAHAPCSRPLAAQQLPPGLAGLHFYPARPVLFPLRNTQRQHAVLQTRLDPVGIEFPAEGKAALVECRTNIRVQRIHALGHGDNRPALDRQGIAVDMHFEP